MTSLTEWVKARKTVASAVVVALVAGVPLTFAVMHPGFPVSDVDLTSRDVWVTNGELLLGGRINSQIDELDASVVAASPTFDVLQDGDTLFMVDPTIGRVESVSPASTSITSAIDVPQGSEVSYGGDTIAIVSPDGQLWVVPAVGDLQFSSTNPPLVELGAAGHAVVTRDGVVLAVAPEEGIRYRIESLVDLPEASEFPKVGEFQLAAVGDRLVALDESTNQLVIDGGPTVDLGDHVGLRLQQTGPATDVAVVATGDALLRVALGSGEVTVIDAEVDGTETDAEAVAAPVNQDGCIHGAWADAGRYVLQCAGDGSPESAEIIDIPQPTAGSRIEFRVNRSVIALNDLSNGNVWLVQEDMRLVENWEDVVPPVEEESEEIGEEKSAIQSFEDALAERTDVNRPPTAQDDEFGIRPGRTTILSLLDNDSDPDGDVLVISQYGLVAETTGILDPIDGGRALQFTPAPGFVGTIAFDYTVDDGRGGTASATVTARVVPDNVNEAALSLRGSGVSVEANQTVTYNVLSNWRDPDGDDLSIIAASPKSGDLVRFTPDGFLTFTHQTSELGDKEVTYTVSDGSGDVAQGTLIVTVEAPGVLNPVGTPDFATSFVGETVTVEPLLNDLSPSGAQLALIGLQDPEGDAAATFNGEKGTVAFTGSSPGIYYMEYSLQAGANTSVGIIRVDVSERPEDMTLPPIAVKDTAYLRGEEPVTISVLSNDVSPVGNILAIQSIDAGDALQKGVVVELLESTLIRVTATQALTEQVNFTYTISDGIGSATAGVTVVPVPALTKHQPPVAQNDVATVRATDIITLDVLANDFHPDDSSMFLDEELITEPTDGIAFVSNNELRFQAPDAPGEYRVDYRVTDPFGETASATAVFTVTAMDEETNRDPEPTAIVARVLAGGSIRIDLPISGIDPDGDSTQLLGFPRNPSLGSVVEEGTDWFVYEASPAGAGTDEFSYQVYDALGATGTATVKIAVIPEPSELQNPSAVPDSVSIRPGRTAQVDLLANDSDPQGAPIKASEALMDVPDGIVAEVVDRRYLVIEAPETEQSFSLRYEVTNDRGGAAVSYVLVQVTPDAPLLAPSAEDLAMATRDVAGVATVEVDLFAGSAFNPAGRTEDLVVTLEGPNANAGEVLETAGHVEVTPGPQRQAIAYRVTNVDDGLSAMAFILVPAAVDDDFDAPPYIDPALPPQYISMNGEGEWNLEDILVVPSGRDPHIYDKMTVTAIQGDGSSSFVDENTIRLAGPTGYRGPAAINFTVSDGDSKDDPKGVTANLTLNVTVGDPEFRDTPPEFTTPAAQVEVGETTTIDLRASTAHPNPQILQEVTYSNITPSSNVLTATQNGSQLALSVPRNTPKGTTFTVGVTLRWDSFEVQGTVNVTVVGSTRPPPVAVTDTVETKRPVGTFTISPLLNDSNPYQSTGEPLRIVDAQITNVGSVGSVSFTDDQLRVNPASTPQYLVIEIAYTIEDATEDPDRRTTGLVSMTITDVPAQVAKPDRESGSQYGGDRTATIRFGAPGTNGKPITSYEVRNVQTDAVNAGCTAGAACTMTGLTNGTAYTFEVRAINENGNGPWSTPSDPITPYGTPGTPVVTASAVDPWAPGGSMTASWPAVAGTGGTTTYYWTATGGTPASGTTNGTSVNIGGLPGGNFSVSVYARNEAYQGSTGTSNGVTITQQGTPATPTITSASPANGTYSPATVSWSWGAVTASPGGSANLSYEVSYNGGGWQSVNTATSYSLGNRGTGNHTLQVRAVNKAGAGGASGAVTVSLAQRPDPPRASLCVYPGQSTLRAGADEFGISWSGQSGGGHTMKVDNAANAFGTSHSGSGSSGHIRTQSYAFSNTEGDLNAIYWVTFDGVDQPGQAMRDIPSC